MKASELIKILQFSDSALPIGAFTFSNGVEAAIQNGVIKDSASLKSFVKTALLTAAQSDGIALIAAHRAFLAEDMATLKIIDHAVYNRKLNEEARSMTIKLGKKLAEIAVETTDIAAIDAWLTEIKAERTRGTHPVTQAIVMAAQGIAEREVMVMHQYGIAMTILSAAMRLMRITHYETQQILFTLNSEIDQFCEIAECGDIEQMSSYVPVMDLLASMHQQSFVRLFMN